MPSTKSQAQRQPLQQPQRELDQRLGPAGLYFQLDLAQWFARVAREQGSGTRDTFNEDIMDDKKAETPGVNTAGGSNAEIRTALTGSDKAIGYLGFSYAEDGAVGMIALDGVKPTAETIKDGSYELARKLYFYTFEDYR